MSHWEPSLRSGGPQAWALEHTTYISEKEQVDSEACTIITIEEPYKNEELVIFFYKRTFKRMGRELF
jgi:hypothetical protein